MTDRPQPDSAVGKRRRRRAPGALKLILAGLLGTASALLIACGGSGGVLIPASQAGPLQGDVEAVEQAAEAGNGNCSATEAALLKTDQDYAALPTSVDTELRNRLHLGIENLHKVATEACQQPLAKTTTTSANTTTTKTATTPTTPTTTTTTTTTPTPPSSETPESEETPGAGGGTPAPGEGQGKAPGEGAGGAAPEESVVPGAGGQESGK
jgi:hypothetical protein